MGASAGELPSGGESGDAGANYNDMFTHLLGLMAGIWGHSIKIGIGRPDSPRRYNAGMPRRKFICRFPS